MLSLMHNFEETKRLLENSTTYYLISIGMDSKYSYINTRYQNAFAGVHGDLVGQDYSVTIHPADLNICSEVAGQAFEKPDQVFPATLRKHDGFGGFIFTRWDYKALFNERNEPSGIFCIGHDITEFIENRIELDDTRESLNKSRFTLEQIAYTQSHEIRKHIANIMGLCILLEAMELRPEAATLFKMINESSKDLDQLIKKMAAII